MKTFGEWLYEYAGMVSGTFSNDELLQSACRSKNLATVNRIVKVPKSAECKFLGLCKPKKSYKVNILPVEV